MARVRPAAAMTSTMQKPSAGERLCRAACPASSALPLALRTMKTSAAKNDCVELDSGLDKTQDALRIPELGAPPEEHLRTDFSDFKTNLLWTSCLFCDLFKICL